MPIAVPVTRNVPSLEVFPLIVPRTRGRVRTTRIGGGNVTEPLIIRRTMREHRSRERLKWGVVASRSVLLSAVMGGRSLVLVGGDSALLGFSCLWVVRAAGRVRALHLRLALCRSLRAAPPHQLQTLRPSDPK